MRFTPSLILCLIFGMLSSSLHAMEEKPDKGDGKTQVAVKPQQAAGEERKAAKPRKSKQAPKKSDAKEERSLTVTEFVKQCMPQLTPEQGEEATRIYTSLVTEGSQPILEDNPDGSPENFGKVMFEHGYTFPPLMKFLTPLLQFCIERKGTYRLMDIGAGSGNDSMAFLLTGNVQVIAVDIHKKQLNALKDRVHKKLGKTYLKDKLPKHFQTLKRNFADRETEVPDTFLGQFDAINLSRVLHFLDEPQTKTMIGNVAKLLKEGGAFSIVVSTSIPGSREERWIAEQRKQGLENPGLVYYDHVKKLNKTNQLQRYLDVMSNGEFQLVPRSTCGLAGPGLKRERVTEGNEEDILTLRTGRFYHTLQSLKPLLDPYFEILQHSIHQHDAEDVFLHVFAKKKTKAASEAVKVESKES